MYRVAEADAGVVEEVEVVGAGGREAEGVGFNNCCDFSVVEAAASTAIMLPPLTLWTALVVLVAVIPGALKISPAATSAVCFAVEAFEADWSEEVVEAMG